MRVLEVIFTQTFTIRTTVLSSNNVCKAGIFLFDIYREFKHLIVRKHYLFASFSHGHGESSHLNEPSAALLYASSGPYCAS